MPKEGKSKTSSAKLRHAPLDNQISTTKKQAEGKFSRADQRKVAADKNDVDELSDFKNDNFLDAKTSKKIMRQAQEQREELLSDEIGNAMKDSSKSSKPKKGNNTRSAGIGAHLLTHHEDSDEEEDDERRKPRNGGGFNDNEDDDEEEEDYDDECDVGSDGYMDIADMEGMSEAERSLMGSFFGGAAEVTAH